MASRHVQPVACRSSYSRQVLEVAKVIPLLDRDLSDQWTASATVKAPNASSSLVAAIRDLHCPPSCKTQSCAGYSSVPWGQRLLALKRSPMNLRIHYHLPQISLHFLLPTQQICLPRPVVAGIIRRCPWLAPNEHAHILHSSTDLHPVQKNLV